MSGAYRGRLMIIVTLGHVGPGGGARCRGQAVPLRPSIVIDSLFTKNMHNEFIIARPICRDALCLIEPRSRDQ
jgi:hypothetical protein